MFNRPIPVVSGVPRVRFDRRRPDHEELPLSRIDALRPDHPQVQLVVLRRLQKFEAALRFQHTNIKKLSAYESVDVFLWVQKR
jgi:hypothetical protein